MIDPKKDAAEQGVIDFVEEMLSNGYDGAVGAIRWDDIHKIWRGLYVDASNATHRFIVIDHTKIFFQEA